MQKTPDTTSHLQKCTSKKKKKKKVVFAFKSHSSFLLDLSLQSKQGDWSAAA